MKKNKSREEEEEEEGGKNMTKKWDLKVKAMVSV
jgi:hypothetical protein